MANAFGIDDDRYEISKGVKSTAGRWAAKAAEKSGLSTKPVDRATRAATAHAGNAERHYAIGGRHSEDAARFLFRGQDDLADKANVNAQESFHRALGENGKRLSAETKVNNRTRKLRNNALTVGAVGGAGAGMAAGAGLESRKRY